MDEAGLVHELASWMNAFKHLAECFFPPEPTLRQTVEALAAELRRVSPTAAGCAETMMAALDDEDQTSLQVDYAGLFVGPYRLLAPPYGSVYLDKSRQVMGESTMDALELYRSAGMDVAGGFNQPPDHIAAELEFMAYLCYRKMEAILKVDEEGLKNHRSLCEEFIERHVKLWWAPFAQTVGSEAKTGLYKALAECLEAMTLAIAERNGL